MDFSKILAQDNERTAFVMGMIYGWPLISLRDSRVFAYSSYKNGTRSRDINVDDFFLEHIKKLKDFLGETYEVVLNKNIDSPLYNNKKIQKTGVSIIINLDINIPKSIDPTVFIYGQIEKKLIDMKDDLKRYFIIGLFDSRGSLDFNHKYISVDLEQREYPDLARRKFNKLNDIIGYVANFNPRLAQRNSDQKNDQFRLNMDYYMGKYGLLSPFKIEYYKKENPSCNLVTENHFIIDFKYKDKKISDTISNRNLKINNLAIELNSKNLSEEEKKKVVSEYRNEYLDTDDLDEIIHSSQNMKETSKMDASYLCEVDNNHITFTTKRNGQNYVEAHHLIPFCNRKDFEVSIDIQQNIICLCPNCHRKIHLAKDDEKREMILPLFKKRIKSISDSGIIIDEKTLLNYYNIK